jgi:drug/metabolite transporter (DMT)-like permease
VLALALSVGLTWGLAYVVLRVGMQHSPPLFFAMVRTAAGGLMILAAALALHRAAPTGWRTHGMLFTAGVMNYSLFYGGLNIGVTYLSAGETAMMNYTMPLWMAILARLALGQGLGGLRSAGLVVGFLGAVLVVADKLSPGAAPFWGAYAAVLTGAFSWAAGSVFFVRYARGVALEWAVGLQNLYGSLPLGLAWAFGEGGRMADGSFVFWESLGFTVVLASFLAQLAFFSLLRRREAAVVGALVFLVPVFAALFGLLLIGEPLSLLTAAGGLCVVTGIALVNRQSQHRSG